MANELTPEFIQDVKELAANSKQLVTKAEAAEKKAFDVSSKHNDLLSQLTEINNNDKKAEEWRKEYEASNQKNQDALNTMAIELKTIREGGITVNDGSGPDFAQSMAKALHQHKDSIKYVTKGRGFQFDLAENTGMYLKAAANMTTTGNLTGSPVISYIPTPYLLPRQKVNFRDLVPGVQTATGLISIFREDGGPNTSPQEGALAQQLTQGALKEQIGYDFTNVQFTANYIGGFVRISKQMLQDLPFLQTYLPQMLMRDYYKRENAIFFAAQNAAALGSTTTSGGNDAEKFIDYIANLESVDYSPNGIVTSPAVWAKLMKTSLPSSGTSYSFPGGFQITPSGQLMIAGIPVLMASWMPAGSAFIADWTMSQIATVDSLKVEFFEQDSDNVQRNLITVRVEARVVLITGNPYGFIYATGL